MDGWKTTFLFGNAAMPMVHPCPDPPPLLVTASGFGSLVPSLEVWRDMKMRGRIIIDCIDIYIYHSKYYVDA